MHPSREARDDEGQTPRDERGTPSINHRMHMLLRTYVLLGLHKRRVRVPLLPSSKGHSSVPSPPPGAAPLASRRFSILLRKTIILYEYCTVHVRKSTEDTHVCMYKGQFLARPGPRQAPGKATTGTRGGEGEAPRMITPGQAGNSVRACGGPVCVSAADRAWRRPQETEKERQGQERARG